MMTNCILNQKKRKTIRTGEIITGQEKKKRKRKAIIIEIIRFEFTVDNSKYTSSIRERERASEDCMIDS